MVGTKCLLSFRTAPEVHRFLPEILPVSVKAQFQVAEMPLPDWLILLRRVRQQGVESVSFVTVAECVQKEIIEIEAILTCFAAGDAAMSSRATTGLSIGEPHG